MRLRTAWGKDGNDPSVVGQVVLDLEAGLGHPPDIVFFHGAEDCYPRAVVDAMRARWPGASVHGGSSSLGVMLRGRFEPDPRSFGLLGIHDPEGAYGVGWARLTEEPRADVGRALSMALARAGRPGEMPAMIVLTAPPGCEEELLLGIAAIVGPHVPVTGGSAADEQVTGRWWLVADDVVDNQAVVVTVLFPSGAVVATFQTGYEVTELSGEITRATGRVLHEIDGRPAAEVYNEWTGGAVSGALAGGGKILQRTSALHPVGRRAGVSGEVVEFVLSFLDTVTADGSLTLFTEARVGDRLWLMRGTDDLLVERAGRVARAALEALAQENKEHLCVGALVVFCAACLVYINHRMGDVVAGLDAALGENPFLGTFTFGEQGCFLAGGNRHGNLMVTVILFVSRSP
jgi:hypothetical protein